MRIALRDVQFSSLCRVSFLLRLPRNMTKKQQMFRYRDFITCGTMASNGFTNGNGVMNGNGVANGHRNANSNEVQCKGIKAQQQKATSVEQFVEKALEMTVKEGLQKAKHRDSPVINFKSPEELSKCLDLELRDGPEGSEKLLELCQGVFDYSVKTGHPHFFNQLYAGLDPYAFVGQVITDVLNPSVYTYEVAPVFVLMERILLKKFCDIIGYEEGDGTFSPGGSYSNMLGMNLARFNKFPNVKEKGLRNLPRMLVFTSRHCHYSNKKNASLLGIGSDDLIPVEVDLQGRMDPVDLERKISAAEDEGSVPFLVVGTSGTTVLGAFDPLDEIADVCQKHNVWLHVDAAWGGAAMFSDKHSHLCKGIQRSDSVTWNPHKMLMAPLQCCVFVTKHKHIMKACHSIHVPYLFQQDKSLYSSEYDIGTKVVQCGRKVDAMKLWLMWKAHGNHGLKARIEKAFDNARYLTELVKNREGFKLVLEPECTNVCFWYLPKRFRDLEWNMDDENFCRKMAQVPVKIKERMTESGSMLVGYQPVGNLPNFFRMVVINDEVDYKDMEFVVDEIDRLGRDL